MEELVFLRIGPESPDDGSPAFAAVMKSRPLKKRRSEEEKVENNLGEKFISDAEGFTSCAG